MEVHTHSLHALQSTIISPSSGFEQTGQIDMQLTYRMIFDNLVFFRIANCVKCSFSKHDAK